MYNNLSTYMPSPIKFFYIFLFTIPFSTVFNSVSNQGLFFNLQQKKSPVEKIFPQEISYIIKNH